MIHVIAVITAKPGMRDAILQEFRANMPAVHAEQGCIEYGPAIDADGMQHARGFHSPGERDQVRRWAEQAALDLVRRYLEGSRLPESDRVP